jgi:hypothetical protein
MINNLLSFRNKLDFTIRQWIHWRRGGLNLSRIPKGNAYNHLGEKERIQAKEIESRLIRQYDLQDIIDRGDEDNYRINLYYLALLEKTFTDLNVVLPKNIKAADIGCSNWFYVRGLYGFLSGWKNDHSRRNVDLVGYEIDAYRRYYNFFSRFDYAQAYSEKLPHTHYIPGPFIRQENSFDIICQFFPFIFTKDHLEWGLPRDLFFPESLLRDAWASLKKNGVLLVVNQGEAEHLKQKEMLTKLYIKTGSAFKVESVLFHYDIDHYVLGAINDA